MRNLLSLILLGIWLPVAAFGQGVATLIADQVVLNPEGQLIASGNVEAFFEGARLTASEIIYDEASDQLTITGPIVLIEPDGTALTATQATLDPTLRQGLLTGARLVLADQLQLAANRIARGEGRYTQLTRSVATSCRVCNGRPPLWEIRADRVTYDEIEQQIYFRNAIFRVKGIPILWLPALRMPDPDLDRARGFLFPEQRETTQLGYGVKLPYFIPFGDHRDLTLTPYLSDETRTLEFRYRQAFTNGKITVNGAVSNDTLEPDLRSYLFVNGRFELAQGQVLQFDAETTSDPAYLRTYGYPGGGRLDSEISLTHGQDTQFSQTRFTYYETLRDNELNSSLPPYLFETRHIWQVAAPFGGQVTYDAGVDLAYRDSTQDGDKGRDVLRAGLGTTWDQSWWLPAGVVVNATTLGRLDGYFVKDDSRFETADLRLALGGGVDIRWPLGTITNSGATHILEPNLALNWSDVLGATPPNEDSIRNELGFANLTSISRSAGQDVFETGLQGAAGLSWTRLGSAGVETYLSLGRVYRDSAADGFTLSSGMSGTQSDWLVATGLTTPNGFSTELRGFWDDTIGWRNATGRLNWQRSSFRFGANYFWQTADPAEDRLETISEWSLDGKLQLSEAFDLSFDARYDIADDRAAEAGMALRWENECVTITLSAIRNFASSSTVDPTTTFGLTGSIGSFATGSTRSQNQASCRN